MKVLVAVDDEAFGNAIADFVVQHQWPPQAEFKVLHVVEPVLLNHSSNVAFLAFLESTEADTLKTARALVRHVALQIRDALKTPHVNEEVIEGHPKEKILDVANNWGANIILVGSHGRRGLSRFILGSVSMAVVSHATCSVIVIRLPGQEST